MSRVRENVAEAMVRVLDSAMTDIHTAQPGIVRSYDAATQTAEIQLGNRAVIPASSEDDEDLVESLPILGNVPVMWPRAGGFFLHFPIAEGDTVLVIFCESDTNQFRQNASESDPGTPERFGLSGAVAIPGYPTLGNENGDASGTYGRVGEEGGPYIEFRPSEIHVGGNQALAIGANVEAHLSAIESALNAVAGGSPSSYIKATVDGLGFTVPTTITKGE